MRCVILMGRCFVKNTLKSFHTKGKIVASILKWMRQTAWMKRKTANTSGLAVGLQACIQSQANVMEFL